MKNRFARQITLIAIIVGTLALGVSLQPPHVCAQVAASDWEEAAGGKMSFDVASVRPNPPGIVTQPSIPLDSSDAGPGNATLFSANFALANYIGFAYKLTFYESEHLKSQLPKWAKTQRFDIQARAASASTKDQMRLMMQSLLADRFKLAVHWEKRQTPSLNLVLIKPGKTGPQLQPHNDKIPCQPYGPDPSAHDEPPTQLPPYCGTLAGGGGPGGGSVTGRGVTIAQLADAESSLFGRPIIDKTGLSGTFDIDLNYKLHLSPGEIQQFSIADIQTDLIAAFRDQLGLKMESSASSIDVLVIDHIEEPSPN